MELLIWKIQTVHVTLMAQSSKKIGYKPTIFNNHQKKIISIIEYDYDPVLQVVR